MHSLDYNRITLVLQKFNYSGEAHANIPPQPKMRDGGKVVLTVKDGHIISCLILDKIGQKVSYGQGVSPLLTKLGVLEWDLVRTSSSPSNMNPGPVTPAPRGATPPPGGMTPPPGGMMYTPRDMTYTSRGMTPPPGNYTNQPPPYQNRPPGHIARSKCPRRRSVTQDQMYTWSILQRSVYMLCDGMHNYEQIAALLSRPLQIIERALDDLRQCRAIEE